MAGNNVLLILRTSKTSSDAKIEHPNIELLDGLLLFDRGNNWLYIGNTALTNYRLVDLQTIHPNYAEECLTSDEVETLWANSEGSSESASGGDS